MSRNSNWNIPARLILRHTRVIVMNLTPEMTTEILAAVQSREPVGGLTHTFYRYPARFSPLLVRAVLKAFSAPGDVVLDPFMGGGTSLVEAAVLGRRAVGCDISSLAVFISRVKTTIYSAEDLATIKDWSCSLCNVWSIRTPVPTTSKWQEMGYHKNLGDKATWRIRKIIQLILAHVNLLPDTKQKEFARCVLLRTAQWALDNKKEIPPIGIFRTRFVDNLLEMMEGAREYSSAVQAVTHEGAGVPAPDCFQASAAVVGENAALRTNPPSLVLTSPPYPGVHVLYHRWQVRGRKETPAPFWVAGELDGNGASYYTLGGRHQHKLKRYFEQIEAAFTSIARLASHHTVVVQVVAFSEPTWQLPSYLTAMERAGYYEVRFPDLATEEDGRLWRTVPNRKWYADQRGMTNSSQEVVLFHRLAHQDLYKSDSLSDTCQGSRSLSV